MRIAASVNALSNRMVNLHDRGNIFSGPDHFCPDLGAILPGLVSPLPGALIIVSGHRRVAASLKVGLTEIYGTFTDGDTSLSEQGR